MKILKYIFALVLLSVSFTSCSDDNEDIAETNPVADLFKIYDFPAEDYSIEVYTRTPELEVGYNEISVRIKDLASNEYLTNANLEWMPVMHMETKAHSAPHSTLSNTEDDSVYMGTIVFQMPGNETEYWDIQFSFLLNGREITETHEISVLASQDGLKKVQVFMGNDDNKYVLAYVAPQMPQIGINDFQAVLYKMESMMFFPVVEDFVIQLDPRMPGMDNHSSPNNQDLVYNPVSKKYEGKLSLTMTGYWRINLKLLNTSGDVVKGSDIDDSNPDSDLYFEIEF